VASLKPFVPNVVPVEPLHDCCSNCCLNCKCTDSCSSSNLPFEKDLVSDQEAPQPLRKRDTQWWRQGGQGGQMPPNFFLPPPILPPSKKIIRLHKRFVVIGKCMAYKLSLLISECAYT
jgi:hypothetical protein